MILLDTHTLIWLRQGSDRLGATSREKIDAAFLHGGLTVSAISFWEIGMLQDKGRIKIGLDLQAWRLGLLEQGLVESAIDGAIGLKAAAIGDFHGDPADRLIVATALLKRCELITADRKILDWSGSVVRHDAGV